MSLGDYFLAKRLSGLLLPGIHKVTSIWNDSDGEIISLGVDFRFQISVADYVKAIS